ncbi:hypothetical protein M011DRAFT_460462 [Sporormia fimetaria CBS 119925]|uniref:Rhodopsin domain-containing protein n=1 Tax=Sporormia fimetaria CBS 119925 TaxID=1340428 RepID=A0A6A6V5H3_9PLEO|nr:hypothetical protein M011DRAFT_460462 [Sporormia fimetaria CBS 119925]
MDPRTPLFPAPEGYIVNLDNPQRSGVAANLWVGSVGIVLSTILFSIRIYTKTFLARNFSADDVQYSRGTLGIHIWELPGNLTNSTFNLITIASIIYCPFLACAKFSLLFFYLRLSRLPWFRIAVFANMFLVVGYNIALVFPLIFTCNPIMKNFDITITEGTCLDRTPLYMATAVLNIVTDVILLVLPIPMVLKLQMPKVQKAGVLCIFGVGSMTCITSAVRFVLLFPMRKTIDQTWAIVTPGLWILIEANLVIITGSLPVMRLFLRHVAPRLIGESSLQSHTGRKPGTGYGNGSRLRHTELRSIRSKPVLLNKYGRMSDDGVSVQSEERTAGWRNDAGSETWIVQGPGTGIRKTETTVIRSEVIGR